jgi:hypothetical protein
MRHGFQPAVRLLAERVPRDLRHFVSQNHHNNIPVRASEQAFRPALQRRIGYGKMRKRRTSYGSYGFRPIDSTLRKQIHRGLRSR